MRENEDEEEEAVEEILTPDEKKRAESVRRNITKYVKSFHWVYVFELDQVK